MAMRAAHDSAMAELAPPGMTQISSCTLYQASPRRAQAMAAPAATLWPWMVRDPPSKVIMEGVSSPRVPRLPV
eukprot:565694-Lingulodinium_polyedra.AAC.1